MHNQTLPFKVRTRDGRLARFNNEKIQTAISKAASDVIRDPQRSRRIAKLCTSKVVEILGMFSKTGPPTVEHIQDLIERVLMEEGFGSIARAFILYRHQRQELRQVKSIYYGVKDDLKLSLNSLEVLQQRYLLKDDNRKVVETPSELFRRVARHISLGERNFKGPLSRWEIEERFYQMMRSLEFLPNSPTLMNAGTELGQLSACFVLPIDDSIEGIFEALKDMAKIHQSGGGTGFSFSRLRPKADMVYATRGEASGPVSFIDIFDMATGVIVQGGRRRGANMGILRCDHPDIIEFIEAKTRSDALQNFNLSVGVSDQFMEAVIRNKDFSLVNPRTGKTMRTLRARSIFELLVSAAWRCGDPGLVFLDEINRRHPLRRLGRIEATNPCGELPLLPFESCNLASLNLSCMVGSRGSIDWDKLREYVHWGIRFLDDTIEVNKFPLSQIRAITLANRKIGLGVMGFADMLIKLGIAYTSPKAEVLAMTLMRFIRQESLRASAALAKERGVFVNYRYSLYAKRGLPMRNATVNTIAPTGTISIIAGCSSGIEPLFAVSYIRRVLSGTSLFELHPIFVSEMRRRHLFSSKLEKELAKTGSIRRMRGVPLSLRRLFVTAFDISAEQHLKIQAAFQRYTDNSVSKTINLSPEATVGDVGRIYVQAYRLRCKGVTIYRYGSKSSQVLSFGYGAKQQRAGFTEPSVFDATEGCFSPSCG